MKDWPNESKRWGNGLGFLRLLCVTLAPLQIRIQLIVRPLLGRLLGFVVSGGSQRLCTIGSKENIGRLAGVRHLRLPVLLSGRGTTTSFHIPPVRGVEALQKLKDDFLDVFLRLPGLAATGTTILLQLRNSRIVQAVHGGGRGRCL